MMCHWNNDKVIQHRELTLHSSLALQPKWVSLFPSTSSVHLVLTQQPDHDDTSSWKPQSPMILTLHRWPAPSLVGKMVLKPRHVNVMYSRNYHTTLHQLYLNFLDTFLWPSISFSHGEPPTAFYPGARTCCFQTVARDISANQTFPAQAHLCHKAASEPSHLKATSFLSEFLNFLNTLSVPLTKGVLKIIILMFIIILILILYYTYI